MYRTTREFHVVYPTKIRFVGGLLTNLWKMMMSEPMEIRVLECEMDMVKDGCGTKDMELRRWKTVETCDVSHMKIQVCDNTLVQSSYFKEVTK